MSPQAALAAARDSAIVADLPHNALVAISGDDAEAFLHGQFTNDVVALAPGQAQWSGWCSPKGRLLATFLLAREARDHFLLALPAEIGAAFIKRLSMFVLRSRVKIADATATVAPLGVAGPLAREAIARHLGEPPAPLKVAVHANARSIALDGERFLVLAAPEAAPGLRAALAQSATPAPPEAWDWSLIRAGIPTVVAATQDSFVPQMANFELLPGVSFHKGCYPGQEIVARAQYRGTLKRRMALAHVDGEEAPRPGDPLYSTAFGEQAAGEVVNAAPSPEGGFDALVVAQVESLARDDLRWRTPAGARFAVRARPYEAAAESGA